jgi:hypothetical protein
LPGKTSKRHAKETQYTCRSRPIQASYEARADAEIRPLPMDGASFEPFLYGDYLWATTTQFVEFKGMESLRKPMRL